jgi:hypothetical protein
MILCLYVEGVKTLVNEVKYDPLSDIPCPRQTHHSNASRLNAFDGN